MFLFREKKENTCEAVHFIYQYARRSKRASTYKRTYRCIARHLKEYEGARGVTVMSNTFTSDVAEDFVFFLKDKGLMLSTIAGYYSKLCYMFRKMSKQGFDVDYSFEDYTVPGEDTVSVYISMPEIERIAGLNIRKKERDIIRDRLVCNCLVGLRIGDFNSLSQTNITGNIISIKTQKTGEPVLIPIHPIVKRIVEKYGGNFPPYSRSVQNYNAVIKRICRDAGLTDKVRWERTIGHKVVRKTLPKYKLVTAHTARKSFATNAYLAGIPTARIMLVTGHKTEEAFFRYICINKRENARILSEHPFFK